MDGAQKPEFSRLTLILGGVRSGKSARAEALALAATAPGQRPVYLATATAQDAEITARIDAHRARRGEGFRTIEEPLEIADAITKLSAPAVPIVVECLSLWLGNLFEAKRDIEAETARLLAALEKVRGPIILVATEVGLGGISPNALARAYADAGGELNQALAARADRVELLVAGLPLVVKGVRASEFAL
jgi:adenosylcobinamide kinase / adenosylcobinamide-phosphate guanylyltransferase